MLTASGDQARIFDIETRTCLGVSSIPRESWRTLPDRWQPGYLFNLEPDAEEALAAAACSDGLVRIWSLRTSSRHQFDTNGHDNGGGHGSSVASAAASGLEGLAAVEAHGSMCTGCTFVTGRSHALISVGADGSASLIDTRMWGVTATVQIGVDSPQSGDHDRTGGGWSHVRAMPEPCAGWVLVTGRDGRVVALNVDDWSTVPIFCPSPLRSEEGSRGRGRGGGGLCTAVSPDCRMVLTTGECVECPTSQGLPHWIDKENRGATTNHGADDDHKEEEEEEDVPLWVRNRGLWCPFLSLCR